MKSAGGESPLAASDIRFPRPRKSFLHPRTLATNDLYTTDKSTNAENFEIGYEEELVEDEPSPTDLVTSMFEASAKATSKISEAVTNQTEVERGAPYLIDITTAGWIAFDHHYQAYQHIGGGKKMLS